MSRKKILPLIPFGRLPAHKMLLAWNEIRHRAIKFANDWSKAARESAEKQTFWNEFFDVFGVSRKAVASFESPVKKVSGHDGFIDLLWKGNLIVEHKSLGGDLGKAKSQAFEYIQALFREGKHDEIPRYVIVSDFARVVLYDLEPEEQENLPLFVDRHVGIAAEFPLQDFHKNICAFAFIAGYKQQRLDPEDPANLKATRIMAELHDALKAGNYVGHELRVFLVRVLFCLFAEDTGIFGQPRQFELYLRNHTAQDGSDLGPKLAHLFEVLNTPEENRQKHLEADLAEFPYVNGDLFKERIAFADFNSDMHNALLAACAFRWEKISPAVFGSLFQEVMKAPERRQLGAHYTAEKNIMKVVRSLFLDDLAAELAAIKADKSTRRSARLDEFHDKLAALRFFDPACGCGNFLVIAYREIRALELEVLKMKHGRQQHLTLDQMNKLSRLDVDQMFGIEIEEFPARIAEVAIWLADHQANTEISVAFSEKFIRIPLRASPHIHVGNALRIDWRDVLPPASCSCVLGNPPFVGKHLMTAEQDSDMDAIGGGNKGFGVLDYVAGWYLKAAEYIQGTRIQVAFVSTSSITQGEQPGGLWPLLFEQKVKIHFGHRTFPWYSDAKGPAHVHCVIIGFGAFDVSRKTLYDYEQDEQNPTLEVVSNISPYLIFGGDWALPSRSKPLADVPPIIYGSKPTDGGHLIVEEADRLEFIANNPAAKQYLRKLICTDEYLYNVPRWCLWLENLDPADLKGNPGLKQRLDAVREFRNKSTKAPTRKLANYPSLFAEIRQPKHRYILVPLHTSESRRYVPFGYFPASYIVHNSCSCIPDATLYHFGVISSGIHMAWMKQVCGRLESRFRYSNRIVYNNFPWPATASDAQKVAVAKAAQSVLDARSQFPDAALAELYDPLGMPPALAKAHAQLDRAVERCYRKEPFPSDRARVEFLFQLYERLTSPLLPAAKRGGRASPGKND